MNKTINWIRGFGLLEDTSPPYLKLLTKLIEHQNSESENCAEEVKLFPLKEA